MSPRPPKRKSKKDELKQPPSRFAPSAFLNGSTQAVQQLCEDLAQLAADRFGDLTGTTWERAASTIAQQLRAAGHDLSSFEESAELQEWHASWHHPRGTFSLLLSFRAPCGVEVTWRADDLAYTARR